MATMPNPSPWPSNLESSHAVSSRRRDKHLCSFMPRATRMTGDYDHAAALFEQSLDLNRKINDQGMVRAELQNLGLVEIHRGNVDAAERYFAESEKLESAKDPYRAAMAKLFQAMVKFAHSDHARSRMLLHRAESILKDAKMNAGPDDQFEIEWLRGKLEKVPETKGRPEDAAQRPRPRTNHRQI